MAVFLVGSLLYVAAFNVGGIFASFSDEEVSKQNKFHTGMNYAPIIRNVWAGYYNYGTRHDGEYTTMRITWEATDGDNDPITIDLWLSFDDGASWRRLPTPSGPAYNLPNTGEYIWYIPEGEMEPSDWCLIKVIASEQSTTRFTSLKGEGISNRFCYESTSP